MNVSVKNVAVVGAVAAVAGCAKIAEKVGGRRLPADVSVPKGSATTHRTLGRIAFGSVPGQVAQVHSQGIRSYIEEQLAPSTDDDPMLLFLLSRLDVNRLQASDLRDLHENVVLAQLRQSATLGALYSRWQLQERMVDFWSNHFNIFAHKNYGTFRLAVDQRSVVRKHALGNFRDMVMASAHSAAMLGYLDNQINNKDVANENYARELMELHTMGVHGGYTQKDVMEVARCFTGWTIENRFLRPRENFRFDESAHDPAPKWVLGRHLTAGGVQDGVDVIDIVTQHPSTARFISSKLARYFLGTDDSAVVTLASKTFLSTHGDIKETVKIILESDLLEHGPRMVKRPYDFAVSAVRTLGANSDGGEDFHRHLDLMGQALYSWPMPDGYPDRTSAWTGSLLGRWNFAHGLATGKLGGSTVNLEGLGAHIETNVLGPDSAPFEGNAETRAALALMSPDFQWR